MEEFSVMDCLLKFKYYCVYCLVLICARVSAVKCVCCLVLVYMLQSILDIHEYRCVYI